jgi:hypothetical protein
MYMQKHVADYHIEMIRRELEPLVKRIEALEAERPQPEPTDCTVAVPLAALEWLFGEGPDSDGKHFGEAEVDAKPLAGKYHRRYWWRSKFRAMIPALALSRPHRGTL